MGKLGGGYSSSNSTSTSTRNLTPYQTALQPGLLSTIQNYMNDPMAAIAPETTQAKNAVNQDYAGSLDRLRQQFLTTGGGQSGKLGTATLQSDLAREGAMANVDQSAAATAAQIPLSAAQLAEQWLGMNFGQTNTGSQSGWNIGADAGYSGGAGMGPNGPTSFSKWG
jgi:hypothetical protein